MQSEGDSPELYCYSIVGYYQKSNRDKITEMISATTDWRTDQYKYLEMFVSKKIRTGGWNEARLMQTHNHTNIDIEYIKKVLSPNYYIFRKCSSSGKIFNLFNNLDFKQLHISEIKETVKSNLRFQCSVHLHAADKDNTLTPTQEAIEIKEVGLTEIDKDKGLAAILANRLSSANLIQIWPNQDLLRFRQPELVNPREPQLLRF